MAAGQVLKELLPFYPGSNQDEKCANLWQHIQELYQEKGWPARRRLKKLTLKDIECLCKAKCLHEGTPHHKAVYKVAKYCSHMYNSLIPQKNSTKKKKHNSYHRKKQKKKKHNSYHQKKHKKKHNSYHQKKHKKKTQLIPQKKHKKNTLLRVIPTMTFIHFLTGKSSGILSDISSDILFGILSGISSGK